ncbi:MAG: glycine zipper 2TM domain-containing protein [Sphingomonadales bacterium]|nr:glycine zipper 2TM domain-containing protein [Sphingomonadales bacterium]NCQ22360.1 glycine zipper 2TM domain-containing protein [Sphingomonadales bacterium]NCT03396.1 glycine zipper 2TM domain-containing protein [Sphingomonadales bacterium]
MRNLALLAAAGSMAIFAAPVQAAELPAAPATLFAGFNDGAAPLNYVAAYDDDDWRDRRDRRRYRDRDRKRGRDYNNGRRLSRNDRVWRGDDGRYHCKRDNGTTGLVIGAVGGALLGRTVDTRGDRTVGTVLGGLAGGLLGREVDRGDARCR